MGVPYCPRKLGFILRSDLGPGAGTFGLPIFSMSGSWVPLLKGGAMHHRTNSGPSRRSRKIVFLLLFLAVFFGAPARAQKNQTASASPPKYDLKTEAKLKGTVEDLKLPPKGSEKEIAHLVLKNGADALDVYLCPQTFLADMGFSFSKGDEIALTGSRIKQGEADLILAREVVKGSDTLVLRDEKGSPVWGWHR